MSNAEHTPGPWTIHREDSNEWAMVMSGGSAGKIVANVSCESCPNTHSAPAFVQMPQEANARLIAAAPELLKALEDLVWAVENKQFIGTTLNSAEAAIARATK